MQKSYILIVRKPSAIISSLYENFEQVLSAKYEGTKYCVMNTTLCTTVKSWYDSVAFYFEPEVESSHINVTTIKGLRK